MNIQPQDTNNQAISDDQELAKVLAGITKQATDVPDISAALQDTTEAPNIPSAQVIPAEELAMPQVASIMSDHTPMPPSTMASSPDLDAIKNQALSELRPLVDKLDVTPEERFDTYLLLIRSTDDRSLIAPAHEAARSIADEARRAQALLDVIKEIDYLSSGGQSKA